MSADMMKEFMPEQQRMDCIVAAIKTVSDEEKRRDQPGILPIATRHTGEPSLPHTL